MKATGVVRKVDELGRLVIPKELRRTMGIANNDPLEIFVDGDRIILRRYTPGCVFCDSTSDLVTFKNKFVCRTCAAELQPQPATVRESTA